MIRSKSFASAFLCALALTSGAAAGDISLSLNLEFNTLGDPNSGGTWTVVAKSDERGIAGIVFSLDDDTINFSDPSGFFHSDIFDIQDASLQGGTRFEIVEGQIGTPVLDVGVIGGTWPSTYADDPDLEIYGSNPDLGTFSGGVELATGSFDPGVVPEWYPTGFDGNQYVDGAGSIAEVDNVFLTVRAIVPEPATFTLCGLGLGGVLLIGRRR